MILNRLVELQAHSVIRKLTDDQAEYEFLEGLVESQKPPLPSTGHHYLIQTPFRYPLPVSPEYAGRFKPPHHSRNCFFGAGAFVTGAYEYAYHWLAQRVHVTRLSHEPQPRTHFQVEFRDERCFDLRDHPDVSAIMNRRAYDASHRFVAAYPELDSILYPSCRDPNRGDCVVTFEINCLGKDPREERTLHFIYQAAEKKCRLEDPLNAKPTLEIAWHEVN